MKANRMTGFTAGRRTSAGTAASLAAIFLLAGCSGMTYGTGKSPGMQTLEDLAGIAAMSGQKKEPIDYTPRPKIVAPPTVAQLPPPGSENTTLAANWPKDPDLQRAQIRAEADARGDAQVPKFDIKGLGAPAENKVNPMAYEKGRGMSDDTPTAAERAAAKKLFAEMKGVQLDANGMPVRRYLSDPPSEYRVPDPASPLEIDAKAKPKKKFKWWWQ